MDVDEFELCAQWLKHLLGEHAGVFHNGIGRGVVDAEALPAYE